MVETEEGKFVRVVDVVPSEQPEGEDGGLEGALDVQERRTSAGAWRAKVSTSGEDRGQGSGG